MREETWYEKVWEIIKKVISIIGKGFKQFFAWFISIFNTWHKLAAIALTAFIYIWIDLPFVAKIETFALFAVLFVLIFDITKEK